MRATKAWPRLRTLAPGWARELEAMDTLDPTVQRYAALDCPILMLVGNRSPKHPCRMPPAPSQKSSSTRTRNHGRPGPHGPSQRTQQVAKLIQNFLAS